MGRLIQGDRQNEAHRLIKGRSYKGSFLIIFVRKTMLLSMEGG